MKRRTDKGVGNQVGPSLVEQVGQRLLPLVAGIAATKQGLCPGERLPGRRLIAGSRRLASGRRAETGLMRLVRPPARSAVRRILFRPLLIRSSPVPCGSAHMGALHLRGSGACGRKVVEVRVLSSAPAIAQPQLPSVELWLGKPRSRACAAEARRAEARRLSRHSNARKGVGPKRCDGGPLPPPHKNRAAKAAPRRSLSRNRGPRHLSVRALCEVGDEGPHPKIAGVWVGHHTRTEALA